MDFVQYIHIQVRILHSNGREGVGGEWEQMSCTKGVEKKSYRNNLLWKSTLIRVYIYDFGRSGTYLQKLESVLGSHTQNTTIVVWDANGGSCEHTRAHTDIYFVIYIQRNFDFKRLIGLIDSDYILWVNKNNKNHRKTFCQSNAIVLCKGGISSSGVAAIAENIRRKRVKCVAQASKLTMNTKYHTTTVLGMEKWMWEPYEGEKWCACANTPSLDAVQVQKGLW